jgi:hypothetical protein
MTTRTKRPAAQQPGDAPQPSVSGRLEDVWAVDVRALHTADFDDKYQLVGVIEMGSGRMLGVIRVDDSITEPAFYGVDRFLDLLIYQQDHPEGLLLDDSPIGRALTGYADECGIDVLRMTDQNRALAGRIDRVWTSTFPTHRLDTARPKN